MKNTFKKLIYLMFLLIGTMVFSQVPIPENTDRLIQISASQDSIYRINQKRIAEFLSSGKNAKVSIPAGAILVGFDRSGNPEYRIDHNRGASIATRTRDLYVGGSLAYNLTGKGMIAGVWENGAPNPAHQEFQGRLIVKDQASEERGHASHVSGTIIAAGINPEAQGMAYEATAHVFSADNDYSEIAMEAANGLLVSNHSYGSSAGWTSSGNWIGDPNISSTEDWKFGIYGPEAVTIDDIAFAAPYYLMVRSAGNENGEDGNGTFPPDGPYDCITDEAIAKNILTVANCSPLVATPTEPDDVVIVASSSWGPADDGRIKPDLAAPGRNLVSAEIGSNDSYDTKTGTSMSSPVVAGNALLLQQLYHNLNAAYMKSATLKGILLHTTLDVGEHPGPDYIFGHGFLDANLAAKIISENGDLSLIQETQLVEGQIFEKTFEVIDATAPLVVSISWTDPKGQLLDEVLDPTDLNLVNDLDVRVVDGSGTTYEPWILDPNLPGNAASQGDNFRDNYEKIEIPNPSLGNYTVRVSHKNTLTNGKQDFSLAVSNVERVDSRTYYRIGGGGNWNDPTKWSDISGGASINAIPTSNSRVVVDENSFPSSGNLILNENTEIDQLSWGASNGKLVFNGNLLTITRLTLTERLSNALGDIELATASEKTPFIEINTSNPLLSLSIDKENSQVNMKGDDLTLNEIRLESGNLRISSDLESDLDLSSNANKELILDGIDVTISDLLIGNDANTAISSDGTTFIFNGEDGDHLITAEDPFTLGEVQVVDGNLNISQNGHIEMLSMEGGSGLTLTENTLLGVDMMEISSSAESGVKLSASSGAGTIESNTGNKFCFDHVEVDGINASGNSKFVLENNSMLNSGEGWISAPCEEVLFAQFSFRSPCAEAATFFQDDSDGEPESWLWDFGDGGTSSDQNPIYEYGDIGTFTVSLTITSGGEVNTRTQEVEIIESNVQKPIIELVNGRLITNTEGESFQWYFEGELLEGETNRLLSITPSKGSYQVEITADACSAISDPFLTLSTSADPFQVNIYPNPTTNILTIEFNAGDKITGVSLLDFSGRFLKRISVASGTTGPIRMPVFDLSKGIYLIAIEDSKGVSLKKKVVIR